MRLEFGGVIDRFKKAVSGDSRPPTHVSPRNRLVNSHIIGIDNVGPGNVHPDNKLVHSEIITLPNEDDSLQEET
jgi:hypothetical protein